MLILNGGSYYPESREVDKFWVSQISTNDPVAFIPAATTQSPESYFDFFRSKMQPYGCTNLIAVDLYADWNPVRDAKAIYIAGGNTFKLIDIMRRSCFAEYLRQVWTNLILIRNSAGAVVLGLDLRTSNDQNLIGLHDTSGLQFVNFSICPHYTEEKRARLETLTQSLQHRVIGLPENSALAITAHETTPFGPLQNFYPKS